MTDMVSTSDEILNLNGTIIAEVMLSYSENPTSAKFRNMMDGFDAYIETCKRLGV